MNNKKISLFYYFISLCLFIFNIIVLILCINKDFSLLTIAFILNIIDVFLFSGGKGIIFITFCTIIGCISGSEFWNSLRLATIIENILTTISTIFMLIKNYNILKKYEKISQIENKEKTTIPYNVLNNPNQINNNNNKENMNKESYMILKRTIFKAKKDLSTGIDKNTLDIMLKKREITKQEYDDIINSIEQLESIITTMSPMIEEYEKDNFDEDDIFQIESTLIANLLDYDSWDEWLNSYYEINPTIKRKKNDSKLEEANNIAKEAGFIDYKDFFYNYPYSDS